MWLGIAFCRNRVFFEYIHIWNYAFCRGPWVLNIKKRVVAHDILQDIEVLMNNFPGDTILQYQGVVMQTGVSKRSLQQKPVSILWIGMNFIHKTNMSFLLALFCFFCASILQAQVALFSELFGNCFEKPSGILQRFLGALWMERCFFFNVVKL